MRKTLFLALEDRRTVTLGCAHCATRVSLDLGDFRRVGERVQFAPRQCPSCKAPFDSALQSLNELQECFAALAKLAPGAVTFEVAGEALEPG